MQGKLACESGLTLPPRPFIAGGVRRRTRKGMPNYRITLTSNGRKAVECTPAMVGFRGIFVFPQSGDTSTSKKIIIIFLTKRLLVFFSNCRSPKRSQVNIRRVALRGRSFARASVKATAAPRNSRGPEGLLLGTPPSSVAEGTQLRARKQSELAKRTAMAKRTRPKALE